MLVELYRYEIDGEIITNWRGIFEGVPMGFQRFFNGFQGKLNKIDRDLMDFSGFREFPGELEDLLEKLEFLGNCRESKETKKSPIPPPKITCF